MINYVMVGTNRFDQAVAFYDALLTAMGATQAYATEKNVGWGWGIVSISSTSSVTNRRRQHHERHFNE
jgi:hypothetical protein